MMIPKPGKRTKTCKTEISGKSLISPFFQRQFASPFAYKLKTEVDFFWGARGGGYMSPIKMSKTWAFLSVQFSAFKLTSKWLQIVRVA
jgi:hypothetical protein